MSSLIKLPKKGIKNEAVYTVPGGHSFTVPQGVYHIHSLVVAGGGAGVTGAGGAGGQDQYFNFSVNPGDVLSINVGNGGVADPNGGLGASGLDSYIQAGSRVFISKGGLRASRDTSTISPYKYYFSISESPAVGDLCPGFGYSPLFNGGGATMELNSVVIGIRSPQASIHQPTGGASAIGGGSSYGLGGAGATVLGPGGNGSSGSGGGGSIGPNKAGDGGAGLIIIYY